jgi:hypothetical protein
VNVRGSPLTAQTALERHSLHFPGSTLALLLGPQSLFSLQLFSRISSRFVLAAYSIHHLLGHA